MKSLIPARLENLAHVRLNELRVRCEQMSETSRLAYWAVMRAINCGETWRQARFDSMLDYLQGKKERGGAGYSRSQSYEIVQRLGQSDASDKLSYTESRQERQLTSEPEAPPSDAEIIATSSQAGAVAADSSRRDGEGVRLRALLRYADKCEIEARAIDAPEKVFEALKVIGDYARQQLGWAEQCADSKPSRAA